MKIPKFIKRFNKKRVERYERELNLITQRNKLSHLKARQIGMSNTNACYVTRDLWLTIKYNQFIKRWKI